MGIRKKTGRSWNSVCRDCIHFAGDRCRKTGKAVQAQDCFAAVCRDFQNRNERQNYKPGRIK